MPPTNPSAARRYAISQLALPGSRGNEPTPSLHTTGRRLGVDEPPMPRAPAGSSMGRGTTEDRLVSLRDNKAALLRPQLEERGSVLRRGLRDLTHGILSDNDLRAKGQDPTEFQAAVPLEAQPIRRIWAQ
jgi:hypothetical protein